ncbi:hypothetical protein [Bacillus sp. Bos-x628]|uniref:hypothetical protein n=1 Tax=Bacillus maqinnsis TaxID=3229854 RepID=UPI0033904F71
MWIKLVDGVLKEIYSDTLHYEGCDTCGYGSSYFNEFTIVLTGGLIEVEVENMFSYALSEGHLMKILLSNIEIIKQLTEFQFYQWLKNELNLIDADKITVETTLEQGGYVH